jgi:hypothetical protein
MLYWTADSFIRLALCAVKQQPLSNREPRRSNVISESDLAHPTRRLERSRCEESEPRRPAAPDQVNGRGNAAPRLRNHSGLRTRSAPARAARRSPRRPTGSRSRSRHPGSSGMGTGEKLGLACWVLFRLRLTMTNRVFVVRIIVTSARTYLYERAELHAVIASRASTPLDRVESPSARCRTCACACG